MSSLQLQDVKQTVNSMMDGNDKGSGTTETVDSLRLDEEGKRVLCDENGCRIVDDEEDVEELADKQTVLLR